MSRLAVFFFFIVTLTIAFCESKHIDEPLVGGVVIVNQDIIIDSAETLTIISGAEYIFQDTFKIIVKGKLIVKGDEMNPVVFRPADSLKAWGGIEFDNPSAASSIEYASFYNGRILGHAVDLSINNCSFYNTLQLEQFDAVVRVFKGSIRISNCFVKGNDTGEGFLIHEIVDSPAIIENCEFHGTSDAIEFLWVKRQGRISNNKILNIKQKTGDGIDFNGCDSVFVEGNVFANIIDYGCEIGNDKYGPSKNIFIRNNVFANCFRGIVAKGGSEVFADGNIFYQNKIGVKCQVETWSGVTDANTLIVENSVFSQSKENDYLNNENSTLTISNSCSEKPLEGENNTIGTVLFTNADSLDFTISGDSDCSGVLNSKIP